MRILFLDDNHDRHRIFAENYKGNEIVHVFTASAAQKALLESPRFELVSLDHDLGDFANLNGEPEYWVDDYGRKREFDGQFVAAEVAGLPDELRPDHVIVHSVNPEGARRMVQIIERVGIPVRYEPFLSFYAEDDLDAEMFAWEPGA